LDFVGEIHPSSSKGYWFVLVATDYFTKWSEVVALKNMAHKEVTSYIPVRYNGDTYIHIGHCLVMLLRINSTIITNVEICHFERPNFGSM
jgi:hypothetical protein